MDERFAKLLEEVGPDRILRELSQYVWPYVSKWWDREWAEGALARFVEGGAGVNAQDLRSLPPGAEEIAWIRSRLNVPPPRVIVALLQSAEKYGGLHHLELAIARGREWEWGDRHGWNRIFLSESKKAKRRVTLWVRPKSPAPS